MMRTLIGGMCLIVCLAGCDQGRGEAGMNDERKIVAADGQESVRPRAVVGAYYFGGWAGRNSHADDPDEPWARKAPTHFTRRMVEEFSDREPLWGWRDDSPEIMERQIDLAADNGLAFFAFCWYWHRDAQAIRDDPKHVCLDLFLKARNSRRMQFCLLIANHQGFLLETEDDWKKAVTAWLPYLTHPQHVKVGGKPLLVIFNPRNASRSGFDHLQDAARKAGLPGVAIAACTGGPVETGFTHTTHYNIVPGYSSGSEAHEFQEIVDAHKRRWKGSAAQPCIPEVTAGWDKRPWEGPSGLGQAPGWYYPDRSPDQVAAFLGEAIRWMDGHPRETTAERLVLIYAWNEFGEGGYIAPTKGDPDARYLRAIRSVIFPESPSSP